MLFIREEEIGFVRFLKAHKVNVEAMDITWSKVANIQPQVSVVVCNCQVLLLHSSFCSFKGQKFFVAGKVCHFVCTHPITTFIEKTCCSVPCNRKSARTLLLKIVSSVLSKIFFPSPLEKKCLGHS